MQPLYEAREHFVLSCPVLHADERPIAMLDPGASKAKRGFIWAYARGELDPLREAIITNCQSFLEVTLEQPRLLAQPNALRGTACRQPFQISSCFVSPKVLA